MMLDAIIEEHANEQGVENKDELTERIFESAVAAMDDATRKDYLESDEVKNIVEAGVIGRKTIVRLSKKDDLSRRIKLAAFQKAKETNAPEWKALKKNRVQERRLIGKIMQRYGNAVKKDAINSQKALLKLTPNAFTRPLSLK
jgi:hypothetical protein